jgi:hypothetical protein
LKLLAEVHEKNLTLRSSIYSALGRSRYLQLRFDDAYRAFDLSRAGLAPDGILEREVLAISLLRQCDCLLLHADDEILKHFLAEPNPADPKGQATIFDRISLARRTPQDLIPADSQLAEKSNSMAGAKIRLISPVRSRLALAKDLLDRAEQALEGSRRNVHWWSCLYQLRAQTEIERILLFLTGDLRESPPGRSLQRGQVVNQMQTSLRAALKAIRQGFDILLPPGKLRSPKRLREDFQVMRFVGLWLGAFSCGAMLTSLRLTLDPEWKEAGPDACYRQKAFEQLKGQNEFMREQWESWVRLNHLSGFSRLTKTPELRDWLTQGDFLTELEDSEILKVQEPGLVLRTITLRIMNNMIYKRVDFVLKALCASEIAPNE